MTQQQAVATTTAHLALVHCPHRGCHFAAVTHSDGRAVRELCRHIVTRHGAEQPWRPKVDVTGYPMEAGE